MSATSSFFLFGRTTLTLYPHWMAGPENVGVTIKMSLLSCVQGDTYTTIRISSLHAAILDFTLPVSSRSVVQRCHYSHWIARSQKLR